MLRIAEEEEGRQRIAGTPSSALHCTHRRHTAHCCILQAHGRMLPLPASLFISTTSTNANGNGHTRRKRQTEAPHPTCCRCIHCVGIAAQTSPLCLPATHTHAPQTQSIATCCCSTVLSDRWTTTQYHTYTYTPAPPCTVLLCIGVRTRKQNMGRCGSVLAMATVIATVTR